MQNPSVVYIDIETIGDQRPGAKEEIVAQLIEEAKTAPPPGNYKKPESIAKWRQEQVDAVEENAETVWRKTALDGARGQVLCIGLAIDDEKPGVIWLETERDRLTQLMELFNSFATMPTIVGHNVNSFDLTFIWQRCMVLGVKPSRNFPKPYETYQYENKTYDTMSEWFPGRYNKGSISLDNLCKALGVETPKGDMDGSKIYDAWLEGKHDEITRYCLDDVNAVRECYRKMNFMEV